MAPLKGRVRTQARRMLLATPHLTALIRLLAPTPMMEALMQWVVDTGTPRWLGGHDGHRPRCFGSKSLKGRDLDDPGPHRLDDSLSPRHGAQGDCRRAGEDDPDRHLILLYRHHPIGNSAVPGGGKGNQGQGDDAHGLLSIIGTVAEGHHAGGDELHPPGRFVNDCRPQTTYHP